MPLVHNTLESLFGGVNQQAAEYRLPTQVEEMINAYPTINSGLLRRNPTTRKTLSGVITYVDDAWAYEYERGFGADSSEKYSIMITSSGMEIVNVVTGEVYKSGAGLTFDSESRDYLYPFVGANGYAATTVKDTTFLVNKNSTPKMLTTEHSSDAAPVINDYHYSATELVQSPSRLWAGTLSQAWRDNMNAYLPQSKFCPFEGFVAAAFGFVDIYISSSKLQVIVDGQSIIITTPALEFHGKNDPSSVWYLQRAAMIESITDWHTRVEQVIRDSLDPSTYSVERATPYGDSPSSYPPIRITRWDESAISTVFLLTINPLNGFTPQLESVASDYIGATTTDIHSTSYTPPSSDHTRDGFIWLKRSDPTVGYSYSYSIVDDLANSVSGSVSDTTTEAAATAMAAQISLDANFTASAVGSVVKITADAVGAKMARVDAGDSYGNQASYGWYKDVITANDLPKNLGFTGAIVRVIGSSEVDIGAYWLTYSESQWRESIDPEVLITIDPATMPHVIVRNADNTFTIKQYDGWVDRGVGDDVTNGPTSFLSTAEDPSPTIKDIFFFKNRLCFMTSRTVVMSEVGEYGNFWRTTVATLLDADPIDATVDTTKVINLEYATYLGDSVLLFSDIQFKLEGGDILSPKNIQISQTSAYEINRSVRPLFMNDRIFFCIKRGDYTGVMEYFVSVGSDRRSEANDITAHCQTYIPPNVSRLTGSSVNNMLFITSPDTPDTIYVYKYYDYDHKRIQSAWFKWTFNGRLYSAFAFGQTLNLLINRIGSSSIENWVVATGIWEGTKLWLAGSVWVGSPEELENNSQFEQMPISPMDFESTTYIDDNQEEEDTTIILGFDIDGNYASDGVLSKEDFKIFLTNDVEFIFSQTLSGGTLTYTIHRDDGTTYSATTVDDEDVIITVPKAIGYGYLKKITVAPVYGATVTGSFDLVTATSEGSVSELLPDLGTFGWYVDGVALPSDGDTPTLGAWTKLYGTSGVGAAITTTIDFGEWILNRDGKKETRGHLQFKTAQITSEEGSEFSLFITDIKRNKTRTIASKYTVGRKPMVYGDARNIRLGIATNSSVGFRINTVSYEGNFNIRSRRN